MTLEDDQRMRMYEAVMAGPLFGEPATDAQIIERWRMVPSPYGWKPIEAPHPTAVKSDDSQATLDLERRNPVSERPPPSYQEERRNPVSLRTPPRSQVRQPRVPRAPRRPSS